MEFEFDDKNLDRLYIDAQFTAGHAQEVVRAFRKRMQQIVAFHDERDFYANKWAASKTKCNTLSCRVPPCPESIPI